MRTLFVWLMTVGAILAFESAGASVMQDDFGKYLAASRPFRLTVKKNPRYADELSAELQKHLKTVQRWIDGSLDRTAMAKALDFFGSRYRGRGWVYRGTAGESFDGKPVSFTRKRAVAEGFAKLRASSGKDFFVVKRKAPAKSLDFSKLLKAYAEGSHYRSDEAEVVAPNTPVGPRNVTVYSNG